MTAEIVRFPKRAKERPKWSEKEIGRYLQMVSHRRDLPFELRAKAVILAPYFGERFERAIA